jgi:3-oxoacyl-[acyl-carrier-protein] synthase II
LQKRRVVVTGVGLVTALGTGTEETWKGLCEGHSGVTSISRFDTTEFSTKIAAEVKNFDPLRWFDKKDLKKMDSFIHYAVAAADHAMNQAGLAITPELAERTGVFIGSGIGGFTVIHRALSISPPGKSLFVSEPEDRILRHALRARREPTLWEMHFESSHVVTQMS